MKWKTVNPEFHEQFVYLTSSAELPKQSLHITVWDRGKNRPDKYTGMMSLKYSKKTVGTLVHVYKQLTVFQSCLKICFEGR